jgi:hypothetical protein
LLALVVIAELFSLASMTIMLILGAKKKWRWLFRQSFACAFNCQAIEND